MIESQTCISCTRALVVVDWKIRRENNFQLVAMVDSLLEPCSNFSKAYQSFLRLIVYENEHRSLSTAKLSKRTTLPHKKSGNNLRFCQVLVFFQFYFLQTSISLSLLLTEYKKVIESYQTAVQWNSSKFQNGRDSNNIYSLQLQESECKSQHKLQKSLATNSLLLVLVPVRTGLLALIPDLAKELIINTPRHKQF